MEWIGGAKRFQGSPLTPVCCGTWFEKELPYLVVCIKGENVYLVQMASRDEKGINLFYSDESGKETVANVNPRFRVFRLSGGV